MFIKITDTDDFKFTFERCSYCTISVFIEDLQVKLSGSGETPEAAFKQLQKTIQSTISLLNKIDDSIIYGRDKN